jgi:hypothetical protein
MRMEHEELDREQRERAEIAGKVVEFIENDLWEKATDAQKLRLCQLFATLAAMRMPEVFIMFVPSLDGREDTSVPRRRYRLEGRALIPIRSENPSHSGWET